MSKPSAAPTPPEPIERAAADRLTVGRVDHSTEQRWLAAGQFRDTESQGGWTPDLVEKRLIAAVRLTERTAGRIGPSTYQSGSPDYVYEPLDIWYQESQSAAERAAGERQRNRVRLAATTTEISNQESALRWPIVYLASKPQERFALQLFLFCKAKRLRWQQVVKGRNEMSVSTAKRRKAAAVAAICDGLKRSEVPVTPNR